MGNWYLIANPVSGGKRCKKELPSIIKLLNNHGIKFTKIYTKKRNHATAITKKAIEQGWRKIICAGGDGTANEIINGIISQDSVDPLDITLAVIPLGTGNDWGLSAGFTIDRSEMVKAIRKEKTIVQDVCQASFLGKDGIFQKRYFMNVAGTGYDAEVLFKTEKMKEAGKRGRLLYSLNIFTSLFSFIPTDTQISIDGLEVINEKALSINVGIGNFNGGGLMQVPHAKLDGGELALTFIGDVGKLGIIRHSGKLKTGEIGKVRKVQLLKGKNISIVSKTPMLFEADGEALGTTPLTFDIVPKRLKVVSLL
ncbi:MAG: diacylglycerol/lipid kinase family protein [bacterium]